MEKKNNLDPQYNKLLEDILENGTKKQTRNGEVLSVFGRQIRHKMSDGFPLLTCKKMPFRLIATELLWFLRGDTNIKYLVDNDCHIWDGDAFKNYIKNNPNSDEQMVNDASKMVNIKDWFINKIKTDDEFAKKWGDLGPVYGKQWRNWKTVYNSNVSRWEGEGENAIPVFEVINKHDQIANLIHDLKTNPDSRRLMVNAWNVGELDQMTLPPCHYGFQVYTRELSFDEKVGYARSLYGKEDWWNINDKRVIEILQSDKRAISLMWNQRSVDTFLGLPFNIASYGLLLEIIAKAVNMVPDELIGNLGDTHLYLNHVEQAKEQISKIPWEERKEMLTDPIDIREFGNITPFTEPIIHYWLNYKNIPYSRRMPYPLPKLVIDQFDETNHYIGDMDDISEYNIEQFKLENYQAHPHIKAPLSN